MIAAGVISAVHVGSITRLENAGRGGRGLITAFRKTPVTGAVAVGLLGLAGDSQANRRYHGGPEKAVYGYPVSGYVGWRADFPDIADVFGAGAMGENLVVTGQDEDEICIGDVIRCGSSTLQVSQIREPCSTLAAVLGTTRVVRAMVRTARCGWYYRVVESGFISAGDTHHVVDRPNPQWSVARFARQVATRGADPAAWRELTTLPGLTREWQIRAAAALGSPDVSALPTIPPAR